MRAFDRLLATAANRVLAWSGRHAQPSRRPWIDALHGELELVEGGPARLVWALGGISVVWSTRRSTLTRIWQSLPGPLRISLLGLALGAALAIVAIWTNVVVPSHESDSEYGAWYVVFLVGLLGYLLAAGLVAVRGGSSIGGAALTGAVTAVLSMGIALVTFVVIDNLFLDVVMQQPDKAYGFAHSGLTSQRDYVNRGNLLGFTTVLPVMAAIGAGCGALGGALADRLGLRREPSRSAV